MKPAAGFYIRAFAKLVEVSCLLALSLAIIAGTCAAQSEEELKLLRMFYKEKDLFSSATHHAKPISQIAENITTVTAKEIEAMNAHSVAEVLNRVPGLFVNFQLGTGTVGSTSLLRVQGSEERHVLVLVDGVPWNFMNSGSAETNTIPVGIIERIEIIKGPASSAWGSALGGVVHIITKSAGHTTTPTGSVQASYGGMDTHDYSAQVSGRAGKLGYYLFGGRQDSDGPDGSRGFENHSLYSKICYTISNEVDLQLSMGVSQPRLELGDYVSSDLRSFGDNHNFWGTVQLNADFTKDLALNVSAFRLEQNSAITHRALGLGFAGSAGTLFLKSAFDEATTGGSAQLIWKKATHTTVLGVELKHGELDQTIDSGGVLQEIGALEQLHTNPTVENTAVYLNDTIVIDRFSITPGIRYDNNSITDAFISPSLGLAYKLGEETILRGSVARGFTAPPLSWTSGGGFFLNPNPSLSNEKAWSYQVGLESAALRYVWIKTSFFRHDVEDVFNRQLYAAGAPSYNDLVVNGGSSRRQGFEFEVETIPLWHLMLRTGFGYVNLDPADAAGGTNIYTSNIGITYDHPRIIRAELFGHHVCWDAQNSPDSKYDDFIWDLNLAKHLPVRERISAELFFTAHNLFNGAQFLAVDNPNPDRWVEAGLKIKF
jgi:vitamin B12 transporter